MPSKTVILDSRQIKIIVALLESAKSASIASSGDSTLIKKLIEIETDDLISLLRDKETNLENKESIEFADEPVKPKRKYTKRKRPNLTFKNTEKEVDVHGK